MKDSELTELTDLGTQVAVLRDHLLLVGQSRDGPELREKIRKLRRRCLESSRTGSQNILPQLKSMVEEGIPAENQTLMNLFYSCQLLLRELIKSFNLIQVMPMDMSKYYENKAGPSNFGNVLSQIILCKQITPDFHKEELNSILNDADEVRAIIGELQEYMPQQDLDMEKFSALIEENASQGTKKRSRGILLRPWYWVCCIWCKKKS